MVVSGTETRDLGPTPSLLVVSASDLVDLGIIEDSPRAGPTQMRALRRAPLARHDGADRGHQPHLIERFVDMGFKSRDLCL